MQCLVSTLLLNKQQNCCHNTMAAVWHFKMFLSVAWLVIQFVMVNKVKLKYIVIHRKHDINIQHITAVGTADSV